MTGKFRPLFPPADTASFMSRVTFDSVHLLQSLSIRTGNYHLKQCLYSHS